MYKYYRAYKIGFNEGLKDAIKDRNKKKKKFKYINKKEIISRLYDIGYIDGYSKYIKYSSFISK